MLKLNYRQVVLQTRPCPKLAYKFQIHYLKARIASFPEKHLQWQGIQVWRSNFPRLGTYQGILCPRWCSLSSQPPGQTTKAAVVGLVTNKLTDMGIRSELYLIRCWSSLAYRSSPVV